ncbi:DUF932 domain-containing protein [Armatimonas sp.]|uniref:DUF932 domain-containing protein n=1 Tax=Armatimonas sp. TaxID=1872638 RepID=UPI00375107F7
MNETNTQNGLFPELELDSHNPSLENVLFPVSLEDVFAQLANNVTLDTFHKAVVDIERKRVMTVVTDRYKLITNAEAIQRGENIFREVFSQPTIEAMELYNVITPSTRTFCHVDYTLKGYTFSFESNDKWLPFLRVTNSYNKTKPLRFDFGFCRAICRNGMIFNPKQVTIKRYHMGTQSQAHDLAGVDLSVIKKMEVHFLEKLNNLKRFAVPPNMMLPLTCKALQIQVTEEQVNKPRACDLIKVFGTQVQKLTNQYFNELGHNGYAALNVLTDMATRPEGIGFSNTAQIHSLQSHCAFWIDDFIISIKQDSFEFPKYISDYQESAARVSKVMSA